MGILLLTNLSSRRDARPTGSETHAPRLDPAEETDDERGQVPDFTETSAFTVAGTAPESRRLPFEPPPPSRSSWAAPQSAAVLGVGPTGCQIPGEPVNGN